MKRTILLSLVLGAAGLVGCEASVEPAHVDVVRPAPDVDVVYYDRGYYEGPNWIWRDREGHIFRERREEHERRMSAREHERHEHHEEHEHH